MVPESRASRTIPAMDLLPVNTIDLIVLLVLIGSALVGYRSGALPQVLGLVAGGGAVALIILFAPQITGALAGWSTCPALVRWGGTAPGRHGGGDRLRARSGPARRGGARRRRDRQRHGRGPGSNPGVRPDVARRRAHRLELHPRRLGRVPEVDRRANAPRPAAAARRGDGRAGVDPHRERPPQVFVGWSRSRLPPSTSRRRPCPAISARAVGSTVRVEALGCGASFTARPSPWPTGSTSRCPLVAARSGSPCAARGVGPRHGRHLRPDLDVASSGRSCASSSSRRRRTPAAASSARRSGIPTAA